MRLVDSGVWIAVEGARVDLTPFDDGEIAVCPAIVHEVLRGANTRARWAAMRELMLKALMLDSPTPLERFEEAAQLFLRCRAVGFTIPGFDCLIASTAIVHDVELLYADEDFERIAEVDPRLKLRHVTRSASA